MVVGKQRFPKVIEMVVMKTENLGFVIVQVSPTK